MKKETFRLGLRCTEIVYHENLCVNVIVEKVKSHLFVFEWFQEKFRRKDDVSMQLLDSFVQN